MIRMCPDFHSEQRTAWEFRDSFKPNQLAPSSVRVTGLYDQGSARLAEDSAVLNTPFIAVVDGTSGVFLPQDGPRTYDGLSGGQVASRTLTSIIGDSSPQDSIHDLLSTAVARLGQTYKSDNLDLNQAGLFGGATGAVVKFEEAQVKTTQWGDAYIIVERIDGSVFLSRDQVLRHEVEMLSIISELMEKHSGDRAAMWAEFAPVLLAKRNERVNSKSPEGYGLLNHQEAFLGQYAENSFDAHAIRRILIASDGLFEIDDLMRKESFAKELMQRFEQGVTLRDLLAERREIAMRKAHQSHETAPEATAILVEMNAVNAD